MAVLEGRQGGEERERIAAIKASFAAIRPPGAETAKSRINSGRVKEKAAVYGDARSPAEVMKERLAARAQERAGGGGGAPPPLAR